MPIMRASSLLLLALLAAPALADIPATQPSEPKEALRSFVSALSEGRPNEIPSLCQANDPQTTAAVADFQDVASAMSALRKSVSVKFGPDATAVVVPLMKLPDDIDTMVANAHGDKCEVQDSTGIVVAYMVRVGGAWKVDVGALLSSGDFNNGHVYFTGLARAIRQTARDIDAGKLADAESARDVLRARQDNAEQPTTAP
jgi:hypothetical protein